MNARTILLFRKYIKNECSPTELDELLDALKNSKNVGQLDIITNTLWQAINQRSSKTYIKAERNRWKEEVNQLINRAESRKPRYAIAAKNIYSRMASMVAVAAVVAVVAIGAMQFTQISKNNSTSTELTQSDFQYFNSDNKAIRHIVLSDGTEIHLNKGTELRIVANQFNRKLREVWLSGEAFFEVAKNPAKPFIIHTGSMTTTVKGTSFNVKAYPQLGENVVSVKTGTVEVSAQNAVLALLTPGKQIIYNTLNRKSDTQEVNLSEIAAWTEGRFVLNNASVSELKLRLNQQFGTELQISGEALDSVKMNAVFYKDTRLEDVMETISGLYGISYEITKSGNVIINK